VGVFLHPFGSSRHYLQTQANGNGPFSVFSRDILPMGANLGRKSGICGDRSGFVGRRRFTLGEFWDLEGYRRPINLGHK
jgi:hypothetical protein